MADQTSEYPDLGAFRGQTLLSDTNHPVSLADLIGKRVLIFFYPKAGTSGCTTQACGFRDAFPQIEANGATVIGISPDAPQALAKWKAKEKLPYTLLSDPDHKVANQFKVWGEKSMYGKKYMGILRSHFVFDAAGKLETAEVRISPKDSIAQGVRALVKD